MYNDYTNSITNPKIPTTLALTLTYYYYDNFCLLFRYVRVEQCQSPTTCLRH